MKRTATTELAHRVNAGIDVALLWDAAADEVFVSVADRGNGDAFTVKVAGVDALDAFYHPYVYASRLGVRFVPPGGESSGFGRSSGVEPPPIVGVG